MPDERHDTWMKDVLGIDVASYAQPGEPGPDAAPQSASLGDDILGGLESLGNTVVSGAKAVGQGVVSGVEAVGEGIVSGVTAVGKAIGDGLEAVGDKIVSIASGSYEESMTRLDTQIKAVKDAGLDATPYEAQAKSIRDAYAKALALPDLTARASVASDLGKRADTAADEAVADVARLKKSAVEGIGAAITGMRDGAKSLIDKMAATSKEQPDLLKRLGELDKSIAETEKLTDRAERAKKLKEVNKVAQKLFDEAANASTDKSTVQAVYKKALEDRYGFAITNPKNMPNTHLDQVYKMFDKVPEADVVQNKMKTLTYEPLSYDEKTKKDVKNTGAAFGSATIFMGDYGTENWPYQDPKTGDPVPANGFSISTLHELGHSVDDRFKIMNSNQGKAGGGGWKTETIGSVTQVFVGDIKSGAGKTLSLDDAALSTAVETALSSGGTDRPDGTSDADWATLKPLLDLCASRRSDEDPWTAPHNIGGRAYHEAYGGDWVSYDFAVRGKPLTVRDYQWRAPGEWFAELYAYSYYKEKPPPNGVDPAITAYMFGGSSAAKAAPTA